MPGRKNFLPGIFVGGFGPSLQGKNHLPQFTGDAKPGTFSTGVWKMQVGEKSRGFSTFPGTGVENVGVNFPVARRAGF